MKLLSCQYNTIYLHSISKHITPLNTLMFFSIYQKFKSVPFFLWIIEFFWLSSNHYRVRLLMDKSWLKPVASGPVGIRRDCLYHLQRKEPLTLFGLFLYTDNIFVYKCLICCTCQPQKKKLMIENCSSLGHSILFATNLNCLRTNNFPKSK